MCPFRLCGSIVANPIIYRLIPSPSRYEIRQLKLYRSACEWCYNGHHHRGAQSHSHVSKVDLSLQDHPFSNNKWINVCATRWSARSGRGCKGSRHQGLVPVASRGHERGVGAWTVAMETAGTARPFAPSHTDENWWSKRYFAYGWHAGNLNWPIRIQQAGKILVSWCIKLTSQETHWDQATFLTGDGVNYPRKGIFNFKNHTSEKYEPFCVSKLLFWRHKYLAWQLARSSSSIAR